MDFTECIFCRVIFPSSDKNNISMNYNQEEGAKVDGFKWLCNQCLTENTARVFFLPIKDGAHSGTVGAASVDMEARCQQDAIFYRDWAMRERGNKELIPTWVQKNKQLWAVSPFSISLKSLCAWDTSWILRFVCLPLKDSFRPVCVSVASRGQRWCGCNTPLGPGK